ncbi:F-box domain-containing protein, partial [Brazilian cedratvirus IHUMI]
LDIFSKKGLPVLEEGRDFTSWVLIYRNSLLAKKKADYFISFYEKTRPARLYVCDPVPLYKIRHAELLGEENVRLSTLIEEDIYGQQIKRVQDLNTRLRVHDLPEENLAQPKRVVGLFFSLSKRGEEFVLQVQYLPSASKPMFEQKVSKERARDILYRLSYYNLLQPHYTFFTEYKEEHVSQPSTTPTYRYRPPTRDPGIITYRDVYDGY